MSLLSHAMSLKIRLSSDRSFFLGVSGMFLVGILPSHLEVNIISLFFKRLLAYLCCLFTNDYFKWS